MSCQVVRVGCSQTAWFGEKKNLFIFKQFKTGRSRWGGGNLSRKNFPAHGSLIVFVPNVFLLLSKTASTKSNILVGRPHQHRRRKSLRRKAVVVDSAFGAENTFFGFKARSPSCALSPEPNFRSSGESRYLRGRKISSSNWMGENMPSSRVQKKLLKITMMIKASIRRLKNYHTSQVFSFDDRRNFLLLNKFF